MTLYHGSTSIVETPDVNVGRDNLDFGKGFYLTRDYSQAERWARIQTIRNPIRTARINVYHFFLEEVSQYKCKTFRAYDEEWLDFIVSCRRGGTDWKLYDIIEGGIANDKVFDTIEIYISGQISKDVAIGRLRNEKLRNQICINKQEVIDTCLSFQNCISLDNSDNSIKGNNVCSTY